MWTLITQNCEEWLIGQKVGKPSWGASAGWRKGATGTSWSSTESVEHCTRGGITMHQHVPWTDQLESSFVEKDLQLLGEELNMSQKLASLSFFLTFFLGCFSLFSLLYIFFSLSDAYCSNLSSSWQICRLYSGCLCFQEGCNIVSPLLPSFREDFQA